MQFDEMYRQHYLLVYRLANRIVRDEEMSKDISQEIFLKLYHSVNNGTKIINVHGWLYRITLNFCYNHVRDNRKKTAVTISSREEEHTTENAPGDAEEIRMIQTMMLHLKEKDRLVLTLYSEGMSYKEMSEISGIPFRSVGKTLTRALFKLKEKCYENK